MNIRQKNEEIEVQCMYGCPPPFEDEDERPRRKSYKWIIALIAVLGIAALLFCIFR